MTFDDFLVLIEAAPLHAPRKLIRTDIPAEPGIYVWYFRNTRDPVYVGKASGNNGLRQRIWAQHLNPCYLEGRVKRMIATDDFQRYCNVPGQEYPRVDKSMFRRNIGRRKHIAPGQATVDYIHEHFEVIWVALPKVEVPALERQLISRFAANWDLYNIAGIARVRAILL
jgi:hypothetical protein